MAKAKEDKPKKLTESQKKLCWNYVIEGMTQKEAYMEAYPNCGSEYQAQVNASKTLAKPHVKEYCEELRSTMLKTSMLNAQLVTAELMNIAFDPKVSTANRLKALDKLAKVCGMYEENKTIDIRMINVGIIEDDRPQAPLLEDNNNGQVISAPFVNIVDEDEDD